MNKLSLLVFYQLIHTALVSKYEVRCPVAAEWRFREKKFNCSYKQYVCLFRSPGDIYHESCDGLDFSSTGSKLIFEPFLNKADCSYKRYQPFTFSTDGNSNCVYQKSICNENGQYVFDQNSFKSDTTCGCYISKGYELVSKPKHQRFCIPSEEDCFCHKVPCNNRDKQCPQDEDEFETRPSIEDNLFTTLKEQRLTNTDSNTGRKYRLYCIYVTATLLLSMVTVATIYGVKHEHRQSKKELEEVKKRKSEELEAIQKKNAEELEEVKKKKSEELEEVKMRKSEELKAIQKKNAEELEEVKKKKSEELEEANKRKSEELEAIQKKNAEELEAIQKKNAEDRQSELLGPPHRQSGLLEPPRGLSFKRRFKPRISAPSRLEHEY